MPARASGEMLLDRVDEEDHVVGTVARKDIFRVHANFRVVHVFVFNSTGELLLQRLALTRERNPGLWGSSVAAYLFAGETYDEAARRRLSEELGITPQELRAVGKDTMHDQGSLKHIGLFTGTADGPFTLDHEHIAEVRFMTIAEIERQLARYPERFTPTFQEVFAFYRARD